MNEHLARLCRELPEGADAALIESDVNRRYYTGFPSSAGVLVAMRDAAVFLIDFRYIEAARAAADGYDVELLTKRVPQLSQIFAKHGVKRVAVEASRTTVAAYSLLQKQFPEIEFSADGALDAVIARHRAVKSRAEFETMCRAAAIADRAFAEILNFIRPGVTERQVANETVRLMRDFGGDGESFETIAASGPNTSKPHAVPGARQIQAGDFFTLDFGTLLEGYCSDMTRTVAVGFVTDEQRRVYETVQTAQEAGFAAIRPGVVCGDVDAAARRVIEDAGYHGAFGHSLGHSLGLEIHEPPNFSPIDKTVAEAGMLLSVEPGIYLEGKFGVRIEDTVWITEDGYLNLAHSPKELLIL